MNPTIDLNCDLGEGDDAAGAALDRELLALVSSANIACGGHAGDERTMAVTVQAALERGVALGAHPSYPDRANFGRNSLPMPGAELERLLAQQIAVLDQIARACGGRLAHVKPHGALYHDAMHNAEIADAVGRAAAQVDRGLCLVGRGGAPALNWWRSAGLCVAAEAFADRRYESDGSLRARRHADALLGEKEAVDQAVRIARGWGVMARSNQLVPIAAATICLHSDTPGAVVIARAVRAALGAGGIRIASLTAH